MQTGKDIILLKHMLDAINEAIGFSEDRERIELDTDRQLMHSLVRCLGIAGSEIRAGIYSEIDVNVPYADTGYNALTSPRTLAGAGAG